MFDTEDAEKKRTSNDNVVVGAGGQLCWLRERHSQGRRSQHGSQDKRKKLGGVHGARGDDSDALAVKKFEVRNRSKASALYLFFIHGTGRSLRAN